MWTWNYLLALALLSWSVSAFVPRSFGGSEVSQSLSLKQQQTFQASDSSKLEKVAFFQSSHLRYPMGRCCLKSASDPWNDGVKSAVRIIIAGAPASGKGTQCETIKEKYGIVHLSTGDMLREAVAAGSDVGKKAKEFMDSGKLVPDEVIIGVVKERLCESDCIQKGWLLDGFPRTPGQALALSDTGVTADCFIFLNVPDSVLVERVVGRRTDPVTGKIYHMTFSPPTDEIVKARLVQRSDDTEEKVKVRLEQFHANVEAVKGNYADIMVVVDGNKAPNEVSEAVAAAINSKLYAKASAA